MTARASAVLSLLALGACDRSMPAPDHPQPDLSAVDPEIAPLPNTPRRRMRDPRGAPVPLDAGTNANAPVDAGPPIVAPPVAALPVVPAPVVPTCGSKSDPCPMQRFMRGAMATAHTPETLTAAFTRAAGMSPDPTWAWVAIATRGADLANAGNVAAAKAQCNACHDVYREPYRALHRARPL